LALRRILAKVLWFLGTTG